MFDRAVSHTHRDSALDPRLEAVNPLRARRPSAIPSGSGLLALADLTLGALEFRVDLFGRDRDDATIAPDRDGFAERLVAEARFASGSSRE